MIHYELSNLILFTKYYIHTHLLILSSMLRTKHISINLILLNMSKDREEWIKFLFYWCFTTKRAHALDLCLIFISRTHFEQNVEKFFISPNPKSKVLISEDSTVTKKKDYLDDRLDILIHWRHSKRQHDQHYVSTNFLAWDIRDKKEDPPKHFGKTIPQHYKCNHLH